MREKFQIGRKWFACFMTGHLLTLRPNASRHTTVYCTRCRSEWTA